MYSGFDIDCMTPEKLEQAKKYIHSERIRINYKYAADRKELADILERETERCERDLGLDKAELNLHEAAMDWCKCITKYQLNRESYRIIRKHFADCPDLKEAHDAYERWQKEQERLRAEADEQIEELRADNKMRARIMKQEYKVQLAALNEMAIILEKATFAYDFIKTA